MRRIGNQRQVNTIPTHGRPVIRGSQVILDIPRSLPLLSPLFLLLLKLTKDGGKWHSDNLAQDVEPSPMGHAHDDRLHTEVRRAIDQRLHPWNQHFTSLETESLARWPLFRQEALKHLTPHQTIENHLLLFRRVHFLSGRLDPLTQPIAQVSVWDVHVLKAYVTTVCLFKASPYLPEGLHVASLVQETLHIPLSNEVLFVVILLRETIQGWVQDHWSLSILKLQGVKVRDEVTVHLVCTNQQQQAHALLNILRAQSVKSCCRRNGGALHKA
mmetsp:Transcript_1461/g.5032  ORF Transcript_1461/g.5032 Transcript_1461/m.5032 type:complete len:271 (-) Transcript_1461:410-1222(-)